MCVGTFIDLVSTGAVLFGGQATREAMETAVRGNSLPRTFLWSRVRNHWHPKSHCLPRNEKVATPLSRWLRSHQGPLGTLETGRRKRLENFQYRQIRLPGFLIDYTKTETRAWKQCALVGNMGTKVRPLGSHPESPLPTCHSNQVTNLLHLCVLFCKGKAIKKLCSQCCWDADRS